MKIINGKEKFLLGTVKGSNERVYMSLPKWSCGWYWSFGYLGNNNCHYHLDGYQSGPLFNDKRNINMYDALKNDYKLAPQIEENLWQFCEQALTIYTLKEAAEVMGRGGSHMASHSERSFIIGNCGEYAENINNVVLPRLLQVFWDTFSVHELKLTQENFGASTNETI